MPMSSLSRRFLGGGPSRPDALPLVVWALAGIHLLLHVATNGRYGMFRDEFYYLVCADHLDWGYVDHPPLSIALLAAERAILGDSVQAIRVLPALLGVALVLLAAVLARELGGGRFRPFGQPARSRVTDAGTRCSSVR